MEKCWTRVLYRSALSSSKVDDGFILDIQGSIRSGSEGYWTSESMYFFAHIWYARKAKKHVPVVVDRRHRKFCKFSLRLPYILRIAICFKKIHPRNSASWFLSGIFVVRFCSPTQLS